MLLRIGLARVAQGNRTVQCNVHEPLENHGKDYSKRYSSTIKKKHRWPYEKNIECILDYTCTCSY